MKLKKYNLLGVLKDFSIEDISKEWYDDSYTVSTEGDRGGLYEVRKNSKEIYYTISEGTVNKKIKNTGYVRLNLQFKKHYVLNEIGIEEIKIRLTEQNL